MKKVLLSFSFLLLAIISFAQNYDFLLRNGRVITGTKYDSAAVRTLINGKVAITDTATMLANYKHWLSGYLTSSSITGKLNISDTASMLTNYVRAQRLLDSASAIRSTVNGKLNISDTTSKTWDWADITGKPNYWLISDTAAKTWAWSDITGAPAFITNIPADSSVSINNRINTKLNISDTASKTWDWADITGKPTFGGSPGGSTTQVQYNNSGAFAGATNVVIENNLLTLPNVASPTTPTADRVSLYNYKVGGRDMLGVLDDDGMDNAVQYHLSRNGFAAWYPAGNGTTFTLIRSAALTATGTATAANYAITNRHTKMKRVEYLVTVAATTAVAGFRDAANQYMRGSNAGDGGFHFICNFAPATGVATTTNRLFVGMSNSTAAPTDVEPSTLLNMFGVGWDAADANIQFMTNDGTGTATKTSLGIAVPTVDRTSAYRLEMYCAPAGTTIFYTFYDLVSGTKVSGSVTTDYPAATTTLSPRGYISVGGTSSVIGLALMSLSMETDY